MVSLLFSNSPFMANQLPQSKQSQIVSAIFDPFGLSAFFYQTSYLSIEQRNEELFPLSGILLINRIGILVISILLLTVIVKFFSISKKVKSSTVKQITPTITILPLSFVSAEKSIIVSIQSLFSFSKMNFKYVVKSIPFVLISLSLLFAVGMEMYAAIDKGIRLPQRYATTGLMVSAIIQNFYALGALVLVFYGNDLYWRSKNSNFHYIEESMPNFSMKFWSIWLTLTGLSFVFTSILILEGIIFQLVYGYLVFEWDIYAKAYLYTAFPLIVVSGFILILHKIIRNKYAALVSAGVFVLLMTTQLGKAIIKYPLLKFLHTLPFDYSDMNGFGAYENFFLQRLVFGFVIVLVILYLLYQINKSIVRFSFWLVTFGSFCLLFSLGTFIIDGYEPKNNEHLEIAQSNYEKRFRIFQNLPQPTITEVTTRIDLFPSMHAYSIKGNYVLENKTNEPINEILINFPNDFEIKKGILKTENRSLSVNSQYQIVLLKNAIVPNQKVSFDFELFYRWKPVNGHQSFNAIVKNGSFMRISRYFPQIGYDVSNEIEDKTIRRKYHLGKPTLVKSLESPRVTSSDFISLNMTVSTDESQIVIGVGELIKRWKENKSNLFQFKADAIPFRFAISSAEYAVKKETYKGKNFEVYYHPSHFENVDHLIENAKITMDYCEVNFGAYPFKTIRFAEISGFTKGFSATAYPATIFMNEQMSFHCNINADKNQDVINELAGHELSHMWWGNNQIHPDDREGGVMLTETLAMYTEIMLLKKMYGKQKAEESVKMHQNIFENEKGFLGDVPLIKATGNLTHIAYSKGAVAMYKLSEQIGEEKVNVALRNFLAKHKYPNPNPTSIEFLREVYLVSDIKFHPAIKELFEN
jgi:hypothetical protein